MVVLTPQSRFRHTLPPPTPFCYCSIPTDTPGWDLLRDFRGGKKWAVQGRQKFFSVKDVGDSAQNLEFLSTITPVLELHQSPV